MATVKLSLSNNNAIPLPAAIEIDFARSN